MFFWNLGKINLVIRLILIIYIVLNEFFWGGRGGGLEKLCFVSKVLYKYNFNVFGEFI